MFSSTNDYSQGEIGVGRKWSLRGYVALVFLIITPWIVKSSLSPLTGNDIAKLDASLDKTLTEISLTSGTIQMTVTELNDGSAVQKANCLARVKVERDDLVRSVDRLASLRLDPLQRDSIINASFLVVEATDHLIASIEWRDDNEVLFQQLAALNTAVDGFHRAREKWSRK